MGKEIVRVECVKHRYPDKTEVNICGLTFTLSQGERVVILGPNGSGKTTLLAHLMGVLEPLEGNVNLFGLNPKQRFNEIRTRIGVVFQNVEEQIIGPTVWDDIALGPLNSGLSKDEVEKKVTEIMNELGIEALANKIPHYLSGGEKRKVALAGAMVMKPELLILDEPFNGLDPQSKQEMVELLCSFNEKFGTALIITTHEMELVHKLAQNIYILHKGALIAKGKPEEILTQRSLLKEANLCTPVLLELYEELQKLGVDLEPQLDPAKAALEIYNKLNRTKLEKVVG